MTITEDIVADYSAPTDGTTDARPEFVLFKGDAQGQTAVLTVPAHVYNLKAITGATPDSDRFMFDGIPDLTFNGAGASFTDDAGAGGVVFGGQGLYPNLQINSITGSAAIATVERGATVLPLLDSGMASFFASRVGEYIVIAGWTYQARWQASGASAPPNWHFFERAKIVSVVGTDVRIDRPLKYGYKSTWPRFESGSPGQYDTGGPAAIYAQDPTWDCKHVYQIDKVTNTLSAVAANGRDITFVGTTWDIGACWPSQNGTFTLDGCTNSGALIEVDKIIEKLVHKNSTFTGHIIDIQSSSVDMYRMDNCTVTTPAAIAGTPRRALITNSTIATLQPGPHSFGNADSLIVRDCTISGLNVGGFIEKSISDNGVLPNMTMSGGIIRVPNTYGAGDGVRAFTPGATVFWSSTYETLGCFKVLDVTQDATDVIIQTDQSGGFPIFDSGALDAGRLWMQTHPAPISSFTNCAGCDDVLYLSRAAARGRPLWSYAYRPYTKASFTARSAASVRIWGNIQSITVNVTKVYTGVESTLLFSILSLFGNYPTIRADNSTYSSYVPQIDPKHVGARVITPASVTGTIGGDTGLALPDNEALWMTGPIGPSTSVDITGEDVSVWPEFTIEIKTSHGALSNTPVREFGCGFV